LKSVFATAKRISIIAKVTMMELIPKSTTSEPFSSPTPSATASMSRIPSTSECPSRTIATSKMAASTPICPATERST
jgi:hypothetical protein